MKVVFMGTPEFAVPSLERLVASAHRVAGVVTQPDRPKGRGRVVSPSPVGDAAAGLGLSTWKPERLRGPEALERLRAYGADAFVVVAYGALLKADQLAIPRFGCINVHPSLLPRHRGAAPVHGALLAGDAVTGVTIMRLDEGLDTGPILSQRGVEIGPDDDAGSLHDRLAELGADLLVETLTGIEQGTITPVAQDHAQATLSSKLTKEAGAIDWTREAIALARHVRAMTPWPGAFTARKGQGLVVRRAEAVHLEHPSAPPGTVIATDATGIVVACGGGALRVVELVPAGGRAMGALEFARGHRVITGERWGNADG